MSLTKTQSIELITAAIDDPQYQLWSQDHITQLASMVIDERWIELLRINPFYLSKLETITTAPKLNAAGYIDTTQLTNRFYRIQSLVRDGRTYEPVNPRNIQLDAGVLNVGPDFHYTKYGSQIWPFPISASQSLELRYSYLPPRFYGLNGSDVIVYPEGFEFSFIYETAARAMAKGGREDATALFQTSQNSWLACITAVRNGEAPVVPFDYKSSQEWGGV